MKDPVVAADGGFVHPACLSQHLTNVHILAELLCQHTGHSYERSWISKWLDKNDSSPMTGAPLEHKVLIPNQVLKDLVQRY